jgi:hypothetical protein
MDWSKPIPVTDLDIIFAANVVGKFLPAWDELPPEYRADWHRNTGSFGVIERWFFHGLPGVEFIPKAGIDLRDALRQIRTCLGSFEPSHENKIAGCAYLLDQFFERIVEGTAGVEVVHTYSAQRLCAKTERGDAKEKEREIQPTDASRDAPRVPGRDPGSSGRRPKARRGNTSKVEGEGNARDRRRHRRAGDWRLK